MRYVHLPQADPDAYAILSGEATRQHEGLELIPSENYVSEAVLEEIRAGDPGATLRRFQIVEGLPVLQLNDDVRTLVREYARRLGLAGRARADLPHFAFAVAYEMDYLLTWNCSHIANGEIIRRLTEANMALGRLTPLIVTPEEILESPGEVEL